MWVVIIELDGRDQLKFNWRLTPIKGLAIKAVL